MTFSEFYARRAALLEAKAKELAYLRAKGALDGTIRDVAHLYSAQIMLLVREYNGRER